MVGSDYNYCRSNVPFYLRWWKAISRVDAAVSSWLLGYVTASNVMANVDTQRSGGLTEGMDNDAVLAWVDNYCKANPLDKIADASIKLLKELMRRRIEAIKGTP